MHEITGSTGGPSLDKHYTQHIKTVVLPEIEKRFDITILLAIESGSRMWGFASPDSDYDVRFIYRKNNLIDYFSVGKVVDHITYKDKNPLIDCAGWDITKTIGLMNKGNAAVIDWLQSPIVYHKKGDAVVLLRMLQTHLLSLKLIKVKFMHHHRRLAQNEFKVEDGVTVNASEFSVKKFLYAIRSALLVDYMSTKVHNADPHIGIPPVILEQLISHKSDVFKQEVQALVDFKRVTPEKGVVNLNDYPLLSDYVEHYTDKNLIPQNIPEEYAVVESDTILRKFLTDK